MKIYDFLHSVAGICVCCGSTVRANTFAFANTIRYSIEIRRFLCAKLKTRQPQPLTIIEFVCETGRKMCTKSTLQKKVAATKGENENVNLKRMGQWIQKCHASSFFVVERTESTFNLVSSKQEQKSECLLRRKKILLIIRQQWMKWKNGMVTLNSFAHIMNWVCDWMGDGRERGWHEKNGKNRHERNPWKRKWRSFFFLARRWG